MPADKQLLRDKYRRRRLAMSREDVISKSRTICRKMLKEIDVTNIKSLCAYKPMDKLNEVDVSGFISEIQRTFPEIIISFAGSSKNQNPPVQEFDLIIVPVLAFDSQNFRLGWGGGWYDRFLAGQPQAVKIGLCFQNGFIEDGLPHESHDIPLDKIITEV